MWDRDNNYNFLSHFFKQPCIYIKVVSQKLHRLPAQVILTNRKRLEKKQTALLPNNFTILCPITHFDIFRFIGCATRSTPLFSITFVPSFREVDSENACCITESLSQSTDAHSYTTNGIKELFYWTPVWYCFYWELLRRSYEWIHKWIDCCGVNPHFRWRCHSNTKRAQAVHSV